MEEGSKLQEARKNVRTPVPLPVSYWLYFKRSILERPEIRELFASASPPLDRERFKALAKEHANPGKWGPSFCRKGRGKADSTVRRMTCELLAVAWRYYEALLHPTSPVYVAESRHASGLGLFARHPVKVAVNRVLAPAHLFGLCFEVTEDQFCELETVGYPSLYWATEPSICYGPLSLINHECGSPLCFSLPRKVDTCRPGEGVGLEEFEGLPAIYVRAIKAYYLKEDQEITTDYFNSGRKDKSKEKANFFGTKCRCHTCSASEADS